MDLSIILPMSTFALVASISPGPVNIIGLSSGARHSLPKGLVFVTGATIGFIILFLAVGYGLNSLLAVFPNMERWITWAGILFLLYLSYRLACDKGMIREGDSAKAPSFLIGFLMQWLNPKAWIASAAGIGAYTEAGNLSQLWLFAALYVPICWLSLSCWVCGGAFLRQKIHQPKKLRFINRILAALLAASCVFLLFD